MKKKISTLMASVLLASAFSAANAAEDLKVGDFVRLKNSSCYVGIGMNETTGMPTSNLTNGGNAASDLTSTQVTTEAKIAEVQKKLRIAQSQIWKVAKITTLTSGQKSYQFVNKLTGEYLAVNLSQATEGGAAAKLDATGNKEWYWDGEHSLYFYNISKDSTYSFSLAENSIKLVRKKGNVSNGTNVTINRGETVEADITKDYVFNALMGYPGNDGRLHFNGKDVSEGQTNILKDTKWVAAQAAAGNFFLLNGEETSINKNPKMLMVNNTAFDPAETYFTLTTDTLAVNKDDASKVKAGTYTVDNYYALSGTKTVQVKTFARPIAAAEWTVKYSFLNDSLSLTPAKLPSIQAANEAYISDGFTVLAKGDAGSVTDITGTAMEQGILAETIKNNTTKLKALEVAVVKWYTNAKGATAESKGFKKSFAESYFASDGTVSTNESYTEGTDTKGSALISAAKAELTGAVPTGVTEEQWKNVAGYVEAAGFLKLYLTTDEPTKYFERGVLHQVANKTAAPVKLVKLGSITVMTLASAGTEETLIQPYASAPTGDAEITADAKLFFIQVKNTDQKFLRATAETDKYVVSYTQTTREVADYVDSANPNAQWAFVPSATGSYQILNRATGYPLYSGMVSKVKDAAGNVVADTYVIGGDTMKLAAVELDANNVYEEKDADDKKVKYDYTGYFYAGPQNGKTMTFAVSPVSPFMSSLAMQVKKDSTIVLGDAENAPVWYFDEKEGEPYGLEISGMPRLKDVSYKVYTKDAEGKKYFVVANAATNTFILTKEDSELGNAAKALYFRAVADGTYLISDGKDDANYKMTINSTPEQPIIEATKIVNKLKHDYFTVGKATANIYRTLTAEDGVNGNAKIYMQYEPNRFLYENTANIVANNGNKVAKDSLNFLGIFHAMEMDKNAALYIDTAYVEREGNIMPQYMLAVGVEDVEAHAVIPCTEAGVHIDKDGKPTTADKCVHATAATKGYKSGRYLVFVDDSIPAGVTKHPALYDGAKRFAFVPAKHYLGEDSLVIDNSKWTGNTNVLEAGKSKTYASKDTIKLSDDLTKATFALKIKDQESKSFYLQTAGGYVRILNGVPVWTDKIDDAAVFNIAATDEEATANEAIEAAGVQVIGGKGAVTVQGAAGKVITVANILGQTIANQVAASDNVTIAAPAGVIVVAVEGEATKVVVK